MRNNNAHVLTCVLTRMRKKKSQDGLLCNARAAFNLSLQRSIKISTVVLLFLLKQNNNSNNLIMTRDQVRGIHELVQQLLLLLLESS